MADKNYTSHIEHKPGLEVEVDWSSSSMSYTESDTGERVAAYLFVATMPYGQIVMWKLQQVWMKRHGFPAM